MITAMVLKNLTGVNQVVVGSGIVIPANGNVDLTDTMTVSEIADLLYIGRMIDLKIVECVFTFSDAKTVTVRDQDEYQSLLSGETSGGGGSSVADEVATFDFSSVGGSAANNGKVVTNVGGNAVLQAPSGAVAATHSFFELTITGPSSPGDTYTIGASDYSGSLLIPPTVLTSGADWTPGVDANAEAAALAAAIQALITLNAYPFTASLPEA